MKTIIKVVIVVITTIVLLGIILYASSYISKIQHNVINPDNTLNMSELQLVINDIYNNFERRKHRVFNTIPTVTDTEEGNIVFYSTSSQTCEMYVLVNGTTFSVKLNP